jgi:hypothetical protein
LIKRREEICEKFAKDNKSSGPLKKTLQLQQRWDKS